MCDSQHSSIYHLKNEKMKKLFFVLVVMSFLLSCEKEAITPETSEFALKDLNGEIVKSLPTDLLVAIHSDLINKGRNDDAARLYELYDLETGYLIGIEPINISFDELTEPASLGENSSETITLKSQYEPNSVFAYCHVQDKGDMGPFLQANYLGVDYPYPYAGTVGQSKRLEGMWLQTESSLYLTRPVVYYSLCNPDNSWTNTATWGQFTGTRGLSKAVIGLKIWTNNSSYSIWYKAHNQDTGWNQPWHNDGQFAGIAGKRLEAFAFHILKY